MFFGTSLIDVFWAAERTGVFVLKDRCGDEEKPKPEVGALSLGARMHISRVYMVITL